MFSIQKNAKKSCPFYLRQKVFLSVALSVFGWMGCWGQFVATITTTDATATELGPTVGEYTVSLDAVNTTGGAITVNYTVGGTATAGDFIALSGSVNILDTEQTATILLTPIDDSEVESDETVKITLSAGTGYTVGAATDESATVPSQYPEIWRGGVLLTGRARSSE